MRDRPLPALVRSAKEACRVLRKSQTPAEAALWQRLRNRQLRGLKFLRQHPLFISDGGHESFFIADFFCFRRSLVVEVDGAIHANQLDDDDNRTRVLAQRGIHVVRFTNAEIERDLDWVVAQIERALQLSGPPSLSKRGG